MTIDDAIARGDIEEFRKLCVEMDAKELFSTWIRVSGQPALAAAAHKLLLDRNIIKPL